MNYKYNIAYKIRAEILKHKILIYLIRNYFKMSKFIIIKFYPFTICRLLWTVDYKKSYNQLNEQQKILADGFTDLLKQSHLTP